MPFSSLRGRHRDKTLGFRSVLDSFAHRFQRKCDADWQIYFWENLGNHGTKLFFMNSRIDLTINKNEAVSMLYRCALEPNEPKHNI